MSGFNFKSEVEKQSRHNFIITVMLVVIVILSFKIASTTSDTELYMEDLGSVIQYDTELVERLDNENMELNQKLDDAYYDIDVAIAKTNLLQSIINESRESFEKDIRVYENAISERDSIISKLKSREISSRPSHDLVKENNELKEDILLLKEGIIIGKAKYESAKHKISSLEYKIKVLEDSIGK